MSLVSDQFKEIFCAPLEVKSLKTLQLRREELSQNPDFLGAMSYELCFTTGRVSGVEQTNSPMSHSSLHCERLKKSCEFYGLYAEELNTLMSEAQARCLQLIQSKYGALRVSVRIEGENIFCYFELKEVEYCPDQQKSLELGVLKYPEWRKGLPSFLKLNHYKKAYRSLVEVDELIVLDEDLHFIECVHNSMILELHSGEILLPVHPQALESISRKSLKLKLSSFHERTFGLNQLNEIRHIWICNSLRGIRPVSSIDGQKFDVSTKFDNV